LRIEGCGGLQPDPFTGASTREQLDVLGLQRVDATTATNAPGEGVIDQVVAELVKIDTGEFAASDEKDDHVVVGMAARQSLARAVIPA
jgi:hypothetical protein